MKLQYRAIEGTNTKTRRIAYITAILLILRQGTLSEQALLKKLTSWSVEHHADLFSYYVHTGEITSTQKKLSRFSLPQLCCKVEFHHFAVWYVSYYAGRICIGCPYENL